MTPTRFAQGLKGLSTNSLGIKLVDIQNSIDNRNYDNTVLRPFAEPSIPNRTPDRYSLASIADNNSVIQRMTERVQLIRIEVKSRGLDWREFEAQRRTREHGCNDAQSLSQAPKSRFSNDAQSCQSSQSRFSKDALSLYHHAEFQLPNDTLSLMAPSESQSLTDAPSSYHSPNTQFQDHAPSPYESPGIQFWIDRWDTIIQHWILARLSDD
ncbi:hypothetical protein CDD82_2824 [Ophiocordyceps australis]|uniref:Uncharacterized protein n=1 Tax=Ophiocordyceps australis TaxID=1399860 RepID=A0A2C5XTA0_9HYPO|nr:hypothetical protein CDD82_2824 [Ophiocordyceps australis]